MNLFILFAETIFAWILILYLLFLAVELLNFVVRKIPALPSSSRTIRVVLETIEKEKKGRRVFVDLGCGMARVLIAIKKRFPQMEVIGYEDWPSQYLLAKIFLFLSKTKARVFYKDLFRANIRNADIIYCYLFPELMKRLEGKLKEELRYDALVIANTFPLPNWRPKEIVITDNKDSSHKKIFVYEKGEINRNQKSQKDYFCW